MTSLQERPPHVVPATRRPAWHRRTAVRLAGAAAAAAVLVPLAGNGLDLWPQLDPPAAEQTVDRTGPALLTALTDLDEYRASRGTFQVVVDLEKDRKYLPSSIAGERTTYLATGSVDGVVDFSTLGEGAVQAAPDRSAVTITLPRPVLGATVLDPAASRVVNRERGVLDRLGGVFSDSPTSEREVMALAQQRLDEAARSSDVLVRAEQGTRELLTGLARSFGYRDVTVVFTGPGPV